MCPEYQLQKSKKSLKSTVTKPIRSSDFASRGQVDLIDMQTSRAMNEPYNFLLVYQDHLTKFIVLRPLKRKTAAEVTSILLDIFCLIGPPHIICNLNISSFDRILEQDEDFAEDLSEGEPGSEDRSILKKIHMLDLLLRQFPVQKTSLSWMIPSSCINPLISEISVPEIQREKFQPSPVPKISSITALPLSQSPSIPLYPSPPRPSCSYVPTSPQILPMDMLVQICTVCEAECTSTHKCPGCNNPIHTTCGHSVDGMEGYGCPVWCVTCWIDYRETNIRQGRLKAKRGQNKQIQRMVKHSNKRIRLAEAGENVLIPIPTLDRKSPFDPQNLPGVILEIRDDGMHRIGTAAGALDSMYMASQFQPSMSKFITPEDVPDKQISLREAILHSSFGKHRLQCNCTAGCNSNRCKCRKSGRTCNSKCHKSLACHNKTVVQ